MSSQSVLVLVLTGLFSVVVSEFERATLECAATGSPSPRIEWRRANNAILPTGGIVYRGERFSIHR